MKKSDQSTNTTSRVVSNRKFVALLASVTKLRFEVPFFVGFCALLFFVGPLTAQAYSDPQGRFRMEAPAGWTTTRLSNDVVSFLHGGSYVTVMVYSGRYDPAALIVSVVEQISRQWRALSAVGHEETSLAGRRGVSTTYLGTNPKGIEAYLQLIGVRVGGYTFVLMLSAPKSEFTSIKRIFGRMQRSFTIGLGVAGNASPIPGPGQTGRGLQAIPVVALTLARSSEGNFTMALPKGWFLTASPGGDSIQASPVGKRQPSVYIVIVSVSDLRYQARIAACGHGFAPFGNALMQCVIPSVRIQLNDSKRQWSPQEAFQLILQRLQQAGRGAQQFGAPMLTPSSASQAFYRAAGTGRNGPTENWGIITMFYFANPMLGRGEVTSLAMLAGCSASAGQAEGFRRTCAGVINSFRPDRNWFGRLAAGIENIYEQEAQILIRMGQNIVRGFQVREQMITSLSRSVRRMQRQTFHTMQSTNYSNQQGWIAAFSGNTLLRDPATGKLLSVPYGYNSYGIDDRGPVPIVIYGNDVKPGTSVGTATVQRMLP